MISIASEENNLISCLVTGNSISTFYSVRQAIAAFEKVCKLKKVFLLFYATETYITHSLEVARFPKAPVLARRKVKRLVPALAPLVGTRGVWAAG